MESIIEIRNLTKRYGNSFYALNDIDLSLPKGKIIGLLGPNGAGKTTLIKILTGMMTDYTGSILIDGKKIGPETKKIVSYLPDGDFINNAWNINYIIEFFSDFFEDFDKDLSLKLMERLQIPMNKKFKELSKGTREKVQLILTLSRKAELYIFDEPIAGVDPAARELIFKLILDNYNKEASILLSTHLISEAEKILTDFVFIQKGKIIRQGEVQQTIEQEGKTLDELFREDFKCLENF